MYQNLSGNKGITLIEILIVISIIGFALTGLLGLTSFSLNAASLTKQTFKANNLAQEMIEQLRSFRDATDWDTDGLGSAATGIDFHIEKSGTPFTWQILEGTEFIDGFTRSMVIADGRRDSNDDIVETGGTVDPDTKKITALVSWQERDKSHEVQIITYLTNWK